MLGEVLAKMEKHNGDPRLHDATRLADLGIDKTQSHRWQLAATVLVTAAFVACRIRPLLVEDRTRPALACG